MTFGVAGNPTLVGFKLVWSTKWVGFSLYGAPSKLGLVGMEHQVSWVQVGMGHKVSWV